jgi:hypothetical protein
MDQGTKEAPESSTRSNQIRWDVTTSKKYTKGENPCKLRE